MKTFITLLVLIAASLGSTDAWAAKCKYKWETTNYRTGEKVLWTNWIANSAFYNQDSGSFVAGQRSGY